MPRAELTLSIPEDVWIGDLSRAYPEARFQILSALPGDDSGIGLAEITSERLAELLADTESYASVTSLDLLSRRDDTALVQFETRTPLLLSPIQRSGIPLEMPFTLVDGEARWEITAPQDRLSELSRQLDEFAIPFRVDRVEQVTRSESLLTEKQRDLVEAAIDAGYYDTPRECSLTELADRLDIAKSTCSETLHRAEEKIVKEFVGQPYGEEERPWMGGMNQPL